MTVGQVYDKETVARLTIAFSRPSETEIESTEVSEHHAWCYRTHELSFMMSIKSSLCHWLLSYLSSVLFCFICPTYYHSPRYKELTNDHAERPQDLC